MAASSVPARFLSTILAAFGVQTANTVLSGPTSGSAANPTFRALGYTDVPASYFTIFCTHGGLTAADGVTYYFGTLFQASSPGAITQRQFGIPVNCTLVGFVINSIQNGSTPSQESSSVYCRINNTTDVTLSTAVLFNAAGVTINNYTGMALSTDIASTDKLEIKWVMPTMATNPINAQLAVTLYFKPR